jgi:predicted nucleic acid-binding protein
LPEPGSDEFNRTVEGRDDLLVSDLAVSEVVSALSRRLRQGGLTRDVARRVQHAIVAGALHLALATSAQAASMASFDVRLGAAARAVGLAAYPA